MSSVRPILVQQILNSANIETADPISSLIRGALSGVLTQNGVGIVRCPKCNKSNIVEDGKLQCHCQFAANVIHCACGECGRQLLDRDKYGYLSRFIKSHDKRITNKGRHHSAETKQKMSLAQIGKVLSDETKKKMSLVAKERFVDKRRHPMFGRYGKDHPAFGQRHTPEHIEKTTRRGNKHWNWKGGRIVEDGYIKIHMPNHPRAHRGHVFEHILVYEDSRNCCVLPWGVIHHRDENKTNNVWYNLKGLPNKGEHSRLHTGCRMKFDQTCRKCNSSHAIRDGIYKDSQRFKCKDCGHSWTIKISDLPESALKIIATTIARLDLRLHQRWSRIPWAT